MTRSLRRHIPSFTLYGEQPGARHADPLHVEDIQSRSRKYLWKIGTHRHLGLSQCLYIAGGPVTVDLEGARAQLQGPAAIIIPAGTVHSFVFSADTQGYVLTLDLQSLLSAASAAHRAPITALFSIPRILPLASDRPLAARSAQLFELLMQEFRQPGSLTVPVSGWLACSVLWVLSSGHLGAGADLPARHDLERVQRFRQLIESHYLKHWPVTRYARQLGLSESSLNRLCRSVTGGTASDFIQQRLALEARRRLVYVAEPVAAIAVQLGFKDPAYFCRFFRRRTGLSPSRFRRT